MKNVLNAMQDGMLKTHIFISVGYLIALPHRSPYNPTNYRINEQTIMFNQLTERLSTTLEKLRGVHRFTEDNIKEAIGDIRKALIEADVALPVVKTFIETVTSSAIGQTIVKQVRPEEAFVKLVQDELTTVLGGETTEINLRAQKPVVILMAGLQGSGKTTTTAKLAKWLSTTQKKTVMVTSTDVYRPAALDQLETLAKTIFGCINYRYRRSFAYRRCHDG